MYEFTHIGLDVHKDTIAVAVLRSGTTTCDERVIPNTPEAVRKLLSGHPDPSLLRTCYEAGPTGYDTQRLIASLGIACDVIAPSLIPRRAGVRVKTDRSDARNLAHLHRAGELTCVRVPTPAEEAVRDLVRTREELKSDRRIARQRIRSFLLRYGRRYPAPGARWSWRFEVWMRALRFDEPASQAAFEHLLGAYFVRDSQLCAVDRQIAELATLDPLAGGVARLRAFRGIDTLTAVTLLTETGDFRRFGSAGFYMAFTGLTPSEHSSGATIRHGSITKTGNRHVRRVLVEAAWAYRYAPAVRGAHAKRLEGQPPEVAAYSWAAQCRLHATYRKLAARKGPNKAVVAVARELAGFVWGAMTQDIGA
ncbi:IS110 family transposase [Candidatus Cryosericum septentrionale]|jgi:transposase|nr:IS110 family transposase [Candidatus Cryosericum septentrionale]